MRVDELRTMNYEVSEAIAPTWERRRAFIEDVSASVREWMVRELAPQPGDTVLELAAGVGDTGFEVAPVVGEGGRLISTDFSPKMVEAARRRGEELGIENVEYRVADAEDLELETDSVDGALCRFGYMLMADPTAALSETRRVLRDGGRLTLAVWGPPEQNPFFALIAMNLVQRGHLPPPDPDAPGLFSLASEERLRELLQTAGFGDARAENLPVRFRFADVGEYLTITADTAGPLAIALRQLPEEERAEIKAALEQAFAPFAADGGYELPGVALGAVAS